MKMTKKIMALAAVLVMTVQAWAQQQVTVVYKLDGKTSTEAAAGTVAYDVANDRCTLTVTPKSGNYIELANISAERVISGNLAQTPRRAPGMDNVIEVSAAGDNEDPSGTTVYSFEMPEDRSYDVEVTADFQTRQSIEGGTLTINVPAEGYYYDWNPKTPGVTVTLGTDNLEDGDYDVAYSDNTNAGEATVTVTGLKKYTGTLTGHFTIQKTPLALTVDITGWTYGAYSEETNAPQVSGNINQSEVTIEYKQKEADDEAYSTELPVNAGNYTVRASIAETDNFLAGSATKDFTISKAELGNLSVTLDGWTYGDEANTPVVIGNRGNGAETFAYMMQDAPEENWSEEAPVNAGAYIVKATVAESDNYLGAEAQSYFRISEASLADVTIDDIADQTYTGSQITPAITVTFKGQVVDASEYNVEYGENKNVGEGTVSLTTKGVNFTAADINPSKTFTIEAKELTEEMFYMEEEVDFIYTGEPQTPEVFGTDGEFGLEEGTDFDVEYTNNTNVGTATITITGKDNYQGEVTLHFQIKRQLDVTFNVEGGWATYYARENLQVPDGLKAYYVTGVNGTVVSVSELEFIPVGEGVLLQAELPSDNYVAGAYEGDAKPAATNLLRGCAEATPVADLTAENNIYVLYDGGFVKTTSGTIAADRAYLPLSKEQAAGARLTISLDDETTGISDATRLTDKVQWTKDNVYDLQGRRVAQPAKGLFIVNGKKVVVK